MEKQVLTVEQMQELIVLGVDASKASMRWIKIISITNMPYLLITSELKEDNESTNNFDVIPTFTLQDIINLLPHYIEDKEIGRFDYELRVKKDGVIYESYDVYDELGDTFVLNDYNIYDDECKTILDCAFKMLKWCINEGYITREKISNFPN